MFSKVGCKISNKQLGASPGYEEALATVIQNGMRDPPDVIANAARTSWVDYRFGVPRLSGEKRKSRIDEGLPRKRSKTTCTEQSFIRQRRSVRCPTMSVSDAAKEIDSLQVQKWTDEHAAEEKFTKNK